MSVKNQNLVTAPWTMDNLNEKTNAILNSLPRDQIEAMSDAIHTAEGILLSAQSDNEEEHKELTRLAKTDVNEFMNIYVNKYLNRRMAGNRANVSGGRKSRRTKRRGTKRKKTRRRRR